jgi:hypothetical protein
MPEHTPSMEAVKLLFDRAGLTVAPDHLPEMHEAYLLLQAMRERVRSARGYDAEPAHIFTPARRS